MDYAQFFHKPFSENTRLIPALSTLSFACHCKIFSEAFSGKQPNIEKKSFSLKSFSSENILQKKKYFTAKQIETYETMSHAARV